MIRVMLCYADLCCVVMLWSELCRTVCLSLSLSVSHTHTWIKRKREKNREEMRKEKRINMSCHWKAGLTETSKKPEDNYHWWKASWQLNSEAIYLGIASSFLWEPKVPLDYTLKWVLIAYAFWYCTEKSENGKYGCHFKKSQPRKCHVLPRVI